MLHCFGCGKDLPDNLAYCLYCGAPLEDEDEPTVVYPPPPTPEPIVYERRRGSGIGKFILGSLLGGLLVILLLVIGAVVLFSFMKDDDRATNQAVNIAPTSSPTPVKSPTPKKSSPSPTPAETNENIDVQKPSERECRIINPAGGSVNLRRYCDTRDCSMDASTLYTQGDPGDIVVPTGKPSKTTGRFTWVQVRYRGESVWISSSRMTCDQ